MTRRSPTTCSPGCSGSLPTSRTPSGSLTGGRLAGDSADADPELEAWHRRLEARRGRQPQSPAEAETLMRRHNPAFIPRNHNVEEALAAATSGGRLAR